MASSAPSFGFMPAARIHAASSPYGPAASRTPIAKIEDLKGMKMRVAGGLMELTAQKLGGVPVKLPETLLNVAHTGLFSTENVSTAPSGAVAIGGNE